MELRQVAKDRVSLGFDLHPMVVPFSMESKVASIASISACIRAARGRPHQANFVIVAERPDANAGKLGYLAHFESHSSSPLQKTNKL